MTFLQAVQACQRRWWIPVVLVVVAVAAVYALNPASKNQKPQYVASTIQLVNPSSNGTTSAVNLPEAQLEVKVGSVPGAAAKILKYQGNPVALAAIPQVSINPSVGTLTISVSGPDGARDAAIANAFANALNLHTTQTAINAYESQINTIQNQLNSLQTQITANEPNTDPVSQAKVGGLEDQYRVSFNQFQQLAAQGQPQSTFTFLQHAVPVRSGGSGLPRSRLAQALIAGFVALLIGLAIAILLELLRPRIRDRIDAEREFGSTVLAEVPHLSRQIAPSLCPGRPRRLPARRLPRVLPDVAHRDSAPGGRGPIPFERPGRKPRTAFGVGATGDSGHLRRGWRRQVHHRGQSGSGHGRIGARGARL